MAIIKNMKHLFTGTAAAFFSFFLIAQTTYAETIDNSVYATGTIKIIKDISTVLLIALPLVTGAYITWQAFRKHNTDGDAGVITDANKNIKRALWVLVIGMTPMTIIRIIAGYYGFSVN